MAGPYEALPQSPNVEDRREEWLRGLIGQLAPSTLYSVEDWKKQLNQIITDPFTPLPGYGGRPVIWPHVEPGPMSSSAGYGDIDSLGYQLEPRRR